MSEELIINSEVRLAEAKRQLEQMWRDHKYVEIDVRHKAKQRTLTQNRCLHLFCRWLADTLNDAGYDMKRTLRHDADIPWRGDSVKEHLWRPVQEALTSKHSTTELTTVDPTEVHAALCRHLSQRLGVECPPWPTRASD